MELSLPTIVNDGLNIGGTDNDNSAADINSLFLHNGAVGQTTNLNTMPSLGGYSGLLTTIRDDEVASNAPTMDTVKAAHSKLNTYGLFGDITATDADDIEMDTNSAALHDNLKGKKIKRGSSSSSATLFQDDVNFNQEVRKRPTDTAKDDSKVRWNERRSMSYDDFLVIMKLPECIPMWDAVQRFVFSVLGDGNGELDKNKNLFEKVSKLQTFQGTKNLDVRCQNFFDDMMEYYAQHTMFKGVAIFTDVMELGK